MDLFSALSHPCRGAKRLLELARDWPAELQPCQPQGQVQPQLLRTARQLPAADLDHLVAAYHDGATVYELARQFGIHRTTVGKHLRARGVDTTPLGLVPRACCWEFSICVTVTWCAWVAWSSALC